MMPAKPQMADLVAADALAVLAWHECTARLRTCEWTTSSVTSLGFLAYLLHAGRYEDDISAAKAYDKAAVYLYGANAITNFGLSQVAEDPTEVRRFEMSSQQLEGDGSDRTAS